MSQSTSAGIQSNTANNGGNKKKSLGTLVECIEASDSGNEQQQVMDDGEKSLSPPSIGEQASSLGPSPSTTSKKRSEQRNGGSRLSLASLFSFSTIAQREQRKRSPCSGALSSSQSSSVGGGSSQALPSNLYIPGPSLSSHHTPSPSLPSHPSTLPPCSHQRDPPIRAHSLSSHSLSTNFHRRYQMADVEQEIENGETSEDPLLNDSDDKKKLRECPLCYMKQPIANFPRLIGCGHRSCRLCLMQYVELEIMENRVEVSCPECSAHLHPSDIAQLVGSRSALIEKYEQFSLRRYLMTEADTRFCPAPDCGYAVIASGCAACPQLKCARQECGTLFCYHCKGVWHANQTCDEARRQRAPSVFRSQRVPSGSLDLQYQLKPGDIKACPRCRTYIVKMDDGSCNHMVCAMCSAEFCWLCLKEISDLHYLSPTGCTFWGKKPWTRKKKLLWQLGTLIGAPVGIALIAGLSIPGIIFGVPVFVGRKVHQRFSHQTKIKRRLITAACVAGSLVVSPVLAVMAVGVGVPIMLAYVYGVVPLSLCRNGGCGLTEAQSVAALDNLDEDELWNGAENGNEKSQLLSEGERGVDGTSLGPALSMQSGLSQTTQGQTRLVVKNEIRARRHSVESGENSLGDRINYEEASTKAMQGSQYHYDDKSVHTVYSSGQEALSYSEDVASTKALAGSVHDTKSLSGSMGASRHAMYRAEVLERASHETRDEERPCSTKSLVEEPCSSTQNQERIKAGKRMSAGSRQGVNFVSVHEDPDEIVLMTEEAAQEIAANSTNPGLFERDRLDGMIPSEPDPFHIRALMDTMKQMTAADQPEHHDHPASSSMKSSSRVHRSNSSRSGEADVEKGSSTTTMKEQKRGKRRFFGLLPPKNKKFDSDVIL
ncbi:unnamed protein product, partial [Mesorhabditis belari]|uniref:RBR-type E3 ubiquitin transferase n=1 Tax=Mesorhabditis belari TaxID=2138241 RepID=A0AAF3EE77_9BILA